MEEHLNKTLVPDTNYPDARAAIRAIYPEPARQNLPPNPLIVAITIEAAIVDFLLAQYRQLREKVRGLD